MGFEAGLRILAVLASASMLGCATKAPPSFQAEPPSTEAYGAKVDGFLVIVDSSSSMNHRHDGIRKLDLAKATVSNLNRTLPALPYRSGLVSFGATSWLGNESPRSRYGMAPHDPAGMQAALDSIDRAGGTTPMADGLDLGRGRLAGESGPRAVILVSDGEAKRNGSVIEAAQGLKDAFGDDVCIYPVLVGDGARGGSLMRRIAAVGGCGFATNADDLASAGAMSDFVRTVFLSELPPAPAAPAPVAELDSDGDGVPDGRDRCPGTPSGVPVNAAGCWEFKGLHFEFDSAEIRDDTGLEEVLAILKRHPEITGEIRGYTDGKGSAAYNRKLSERRANAARDWLVERGTDGSRLRAIGLGMSDPVATNDTEEGRAMNRRVELEPDR